MKLAAAIEEGLAGFECEGQREAAMAASTEAMLRLASRLEQAGSEGASRLDAAGDLDQDVVMSEAEGSGADGAVGADAGQRGHTLKPTISEGSSPISLLFPSAQTQHESLASGQAEAGTGGVAGGGDEYAGGAR